jgi:hypothetical protein
LLQHKDQHKSRSEHTQRAHGAKSKRTSSIESNGSGGISSSGSIDSRRNLQHGWGRMVL